MPSPFPGMDPFLEAHWGDVHACYHPLALRSSPPEFKTLPLGAWSGLTGA